MSPTRLRWLQVVRQFSRFSAHSFVKTWKDISRGIKTTVRKGRKWVLTLLCWGVPDSKGSVHPNDHETNWTTHHLVVSSFRFTCFWHICLCLSDTREVNWIMCAAEFHLENLPVKGHIPLRVSEKIWVVWSVLNLIYCSVLSLKTCSVILSVLSCAVAS